MNHIMVQVLILCLILMLLLNMISEPRYQLYIVINIIVKYIIIKWPTFKKIEKNKNII